MTAPTVTVIVLNHNGMTFLKGCFDSLLAATYPDTELLMVDNGSTDDSVAFVEQNYQTVTVIHSGGNIGYSAANNLGVKRASGEYVVLLNNDVEVTPGWLEPLVAEFESDPSIVACQPKLLHMHNRKSFEYAGAAGGFMDRLGYPYLRGRVFTTIEADLGQYDTSVDLFWASGAALAIRKEAFIAAGGLDEAFVHHMEEIDLCWRLHLQGYRLRVRPDSVVYHYAGGTIKPDSFRKTYWNHRNSVFMLIKNYSSTRLLWVLPSRFLLDIALVLKSFMVLDLKRVVAVIVAYGWLAFHLFLICRKRREVQHQREADDEVIDATMHPTSLVFSYYIRGWKTYREIAGEA
ncbi:glycosyltransferase family 2 protein [Candidatus Neomarinimicrobiota bacterium]